MPDGAMEVVDSMLDQGIGFDAMVCVSDLVALGAMRALMRRGLSVPSDVAVVGYDDIELAAHMHPALTTVRQDTTKAGRLLVTKLLSMMEGGQATSEVLPTDLVVRETCGA
jgi:DNA-binding LacI/PurR family transcriptional regulator